MERVGNPDHGVAVPRPDRRPYEQPTLIVHGNLASITRTFGPLGVGSDSSETGIFTYLSAGPA
jgi:hypothetical protein